MIKWRWLVLLSVILGYVFAFHSSIWISTARQQLNLDPPANRMMYTRSHSYYGNNPWIRLLIDFAKSYSEGDPWKRALESLVRTGGDDAVRVLRDVVMDMGKDKRIRARSIVALGRIGSKSAIEAVEEFERFAGKRASSEFRFGRVF